MPISLTPLRGAAIRPWHFIAVCSRYAPPLHTARADLKVTQTYVHSCSHPFPPWRISTRLEFRAISYGIKCTTRRAMRANNEILTLRGRVPYRRERGARCARLYVAYVVYVFGRETEGNKRGERARDIFARCIFHGVARPAAYLDWNAYGRGKRSLLPPLIYISSRAAGKNADNRDRLSDFPASGGKNDWTSLSFTTFSSVYEHGGFRLGFQIVPRDAFYSH